MFPLPPRATEEGDARLGGTHPGMVDHVAGVFWANQQQIARQMRVIAQLHDEAGQDRAPFVGDDLAAAFSLHPATGADIVLKATAAVRLVGLVEAMEALEITDRHVHAVTGELSRWRLEPEVAQQIVTTVLTRTRAWVAAGRGTRSWPTPGELKRKIRAAVLLHDADAAKKAREKAAHDRGADLYQSGIGEATVTITGPEVQLLRVWAALEARAHALGDLPGDERTFQQRLFDAAEELLTVDAEQPDSGGLSSVPGRTQSGEAVQVWVRGVQLQVVVPYSVTRGLDVELCEVPGYGPVLPATARELMAGASTLQRVAINGDTGELIGVDDKVPLPRDRGEAPVAADEELTLPLATPDVEADPLEEALAPEALPADQPDGRETDEPVDPDEDLTPAQAARRRIEQLPPLPEPPPPPPLPEPVVPQAVLDAIGKIIVNPLPTAPPAEDRYRPSGRLARHVNARDRTCTFPGCTVPAVRCDRDHRTAYPHGSTCPGNLHALCRRHHIAKQVYFTVTIDPQTGDTIWTTPDGRQYRRPPPDY